MSTSLIFAIKAVSISDGLHWRDELMKVVVKKVSYFNYFSFNEHHCFNTPGSHYTVSVVDHISAKYLWSLVVNKPNKACMEKSDQVLFTFLLNMISTLLKIEGIVFLGTHMRRT